MLKPYPKMKDLGVEWISKIPTHWESGRLGHFVELISGFAFQSDKFYDGENGIRLIRGDNVTEGKIRWGEKTRKWKRITPDLQIFRLKEEDVLIGMDGSKVGKNYAIVTSDDTPSLLVQRVARLRSKGELTQKFLYYLIGNDSFLQYIDSVKTNVAIPHMSPKNIKNYEIPIPTKKEQVWISKFLVNKVSKIDSKLQKNQKMIDLLKQKKQLIINQAITKGLDKTVQLNDSGVEWIGNIPNNWKILPLKYIGKLSTGGTPSTGIDAYWKNGTIPWISSGEVNNNIIKNHITKITQLGLKESSTKILPKGCVLIAITGEGVTRGRTSVLEINACTNQSIAGIIIDHSKISKYFLWYYIQSQYQHLRNQSHGSVQSGLNLNILKNYPIPLPSLAEQKQIVDFLNFKILKINSLIIKIKLNHIKLQEFRKSQISSAVTGKIDVTNLAQ